MEQTDLLTNHDIDRLFQATAEMIYQTDIDHGDGTSFWPFHPLMLDPIVAPFIFAELYRLFKLLEEKGYSWEKIASLIKNPNCLSDYQLLWSGGAETISRISNEKKYYLASAFARILRILRHNEPFCENFRNPVWTTAEVTSHIKQSGRIFLQSRESRSILAKIEGMLMNYCELLYFYMLDFSRMFHGPYMLNKNQIFVKEFFNLKAGDMWDTVADFPIDSFREVGIYPRSMEIKVFFLGHVQTKPSFPEGLNEFSLDVDNRPIQSEKQLYELYYELDQKITKASNKMANSVGQNFLLKRGIDMFIYSLKSLYASVGEPWQRILPDVYKFAKQYKSHIPPPWGKDYTRSKAIKYLIKQMDFRV